jgi:tetratricopeptide (TPR) repeat protein
MLECAAMSAACTPSPASFRHLRRGIVLCAALWLVGCRAADGPGTGLAIERDRLPADVEALLAIADETDRTTRRLPALVRAAAAMEKAAALAPDNYDVAWRAARAFVTVAENLKAKDMQARVASEAVSYAKRAVALGPDRPEGLYFKGAAVGLRASVQLAPTRETQARIEEPLSRLLEIDTSFERGGVLRILGTLYVKAPAWPAGVGDVDEGLELLERAVAEYPDEPLNHFFLAEAYAKLGRFDAARAALLAVLGFPREGRWALVGGRYRNQARQLLRDLEGR